MADQRRRRRLKKGAARSTVVYVETSSSSDSDEPFCAPQRRRQRVDVVPVAFGQIDPGTSTQEAPSPPLEDEVTGPVHHSSGAESSASDAVLSFHSNEDLMNESVQSGRVSPENQSLSLSNSDADGSDADGSDANIGPQTSDSVSSGDESDEEEQVQEGDQPLYRGAPITIGESLLALMTLTITHSLTGQCLNDLLSLIALHCPVGNLCKNTLYKFKKYFSKIGQSLLVFHYFCSGCIVPLEAKDTVCHLCQGEHDVTYFIELPILYQLQSMFMRPNFLNDLQYRFHRNKKKADNVEDIYDGRIYKEYYDKGFLSNPHNLSFMWYSDGISVFKSSKFSIWPLYLVINELSYKKRTKKENIILAGLWFGTFKPNPNVFLAPFHRAMNELSSEGHYFSVPNQPPILVKGMLICGSCDLPAKSLFMNFKQYNSYHGCTRCKSRGVRHAVGNATVHVHPYNDVLEPRNHDEVSEFAQMAHETGQSVMGVKGLSALYFMLPDIIKCNALDVMHGVFSGVCKLVTHLWFDSIYSQYAFSLSGLVDIIDVRLLKIRPPSFVQRMPRSIKHYLNLWKASEFKLWMMYYSVPVLNGIMDNEYLNHHVRFVSAIYLLTQESISHQQIEIASNLLHSYVRDFQDLYGLRYVGMNVHQVLHFPEIVLDLGPLWVYSCFFLEDMNGKLGKLFHGTKHVGIQICSVASTYLNLNVMIEKLPASEVRSFCKRLNSREKSMKIAEEMVVGGTSFFAVGKLFHTQPVPQLIRVAMMGSLQILDGNYQIFYRLRVNGTTYFSEGYMKCNKKLSTYVSYTSNNISKLCSVNYFVRRSDCQCNNNCLCRGSYFVIGTVYDRLPWLVHDIEDVRMSYLSKVIRTEDTVSFPVDHLDSLCFYMKVDNDEYIGKPINQLECE